MPCRKLNITDFFCFAETEKIYDHEVTDLYFAEQKINYDKETGLVYYNYRYYSPELGRWLSRDPVGERGGVNLYAMVGNDGGNWWDWLGRKKENYNKYVRRTKVKSHEFIETFVSNVSVRCKCGEKSNLTLTVTLGFSGLGMGLQWSYKSEIDCDLSAVPIGDGVKKIKLVVDVYRDTYKQLVIGLGPTILITYSYTAEVYQKTTMTGKCCAK